MTRRGANRGGRRGRTAAAAALAGILAASPARRADTRTTLVDRVVVVVEGQSARERVAQVVTLWDLFVEANVESIRRWGPEAPSVPIDEAAIREAQSLMVEQLVAYGEAVRLERDIAPVTQVDEARDALAARIGGHDALRAFLHERSISVEFLDAALRREVVVARFTRDSVRLTPAQDPAVLRALFEEGGHPYEQWTYEEAQDAFAAWLRAERFEAQRRLWLVDLRSRCRVRIWDVSEDLGVALGATP